ncbi:MAG TPA: PP2C family protein-serine/threonine phosphatase, partial [Acidimicrobiales bacterium]|nr:PP2C family protein-serine/threonine phosphatase [Acidimicrobiales bacterium]
AQLGMGPTELLDRAGAELDLRGDDHFATVLVGKVDTARRKLTLASAGHLPPLLVKGGQVEIVKLAAGVPLGVHGQPPEATTVAFGPGSTVVAFTDGLIEKRGEDLNEGLGRLVSAASATPGTAERLIEHILSTLATPDHEDDIAILAIQSVRPHDQ